MESSTRTMNEAAARRETKPPQATSVCFAPGAVVANATEAAQSGLPHIEQATSYDAILLSGFGGPEGQEDVMPFLRNVTRGRGIPDDRLEEVAHHYRHFGGVSPINDQNRALRAALTEALREAGIDLPVYWGNRNWAPYLDEVLEEAANDGVKRMLAIPTSAYSSYSSCRQYREDWADALEAAGLQERMQIDKVRQFFSHPGFVQPFVEGVRAALEAAQAAGHDPRCTEVLFATHSIPTADAELSGAGLFPEVEGGGYAAQHLAVAKYVMEQVASELGAGASVEVPWQLVYQSRSGSPRTPWLEPDINDAIHALEGRSAVIIVPVGFVSDHLEVMWDLDEEALETAEQAGLWATRVPTPGTHPAFVGALVDLVKERIVGRPVGERANVTTIGPWFDVCRPGCCAKGAAAPRPAIAGLVA